MTNVKFKNLDSSALARDAVSERLDTIAEKFPDLRDSRVEAVVEMHNSPFKSGPDLFTVRVQILNGRYRGVAIAKSNSNMYLALWAVVEKLLERLNRFGDRTRVNDLKKARANMNRFYESEMKIDS